MSRTILFICTGNTCRSPMAEAIAKDMLMREGDETTRVISAGVDALRGATMTPEAREALTEMGIDPGMHRSQPLSSLTLPPNVTIYALTQSHLRAIRSEIPEHLKHAQLLDPKGDDVADPIGGPLEEYRRTAALMKTMIRQRFTELGLIRSLG